jgi:hypothetical protein
VTGQDELSQLETERDQLRSMIAYHTGFYRILPRFRAPPWLYAVAVAIICGIGFSLVAALLAGQISSSYLLSLAIFPMVGLPVLAYISSINRPAGEPEAFQRLADCEERIMELKKGRS